VVPTLLPALLERNTARLFFNLGVNLILFVASWTALAFFIGIFYRHIPEPTGLRKGLRMRTVLVVLTLPVRLWAAANGDASAPTIAFDAVEVILFLGAVMGIELRHTDQLIAAKRALVVTSGLRPVVLFGGVLATAAGAAVTSLLTGEIVELVKLRPDAVDRRAGID